MLSAPKWRRYKALASNREDSGEDHDGAQLDYTTAAGGRANAKAETRQRIRDDRVKTLVALGAFAVLAFSSALLGVGVEHYKHVSAFKGRGVIVLTLSETMAALMEEAALSVTFVDPNTAIAVADDGLPDRERAEKLIALQEATRKAFETTVHHRQKLCPSCDSTLAMFNLADLLTIQQKVLMRGLDPKDVYVSYAAALRRVMGVMAAFAGWGVEDGVATAVWEEQLLFASRALAFASGSWQDAYRTQSLTQRKSFSFMSAALDSLGLVTAFSPISLAREPTIDEVSTAQAEVGKVLGPSVRGVQAVLSSAKADFTGLKSAGKKTAEVVVRDALELYRDSVSSVTAARPWNAVTQNEWKWVIGLSAALLLCSAAVMIMSLREATVLVWAADAKLAQMKAVHRLESSLFRMHCFIDRMCALDRDAMDDAVATSVTFGASATEAERDVMQLAAPARHVLAFVNPCVLERCHAAYEAHSTEATAAAAASSAGAAEDEPVVLGLNLKTVSLVLVDLRCFANAELTADTCRSAPKELLVFLNDMNALVARCGGATLCMSGTVLIIAWNVRSGGGGGGSTDTPENDACQMLLRFRLAKLQHAHPKVRFAVVSGVCEQGVVGSPTLQSYVVTGSLLMLGRILLEGARLHRVSAVADTATFLKLDTLQFRKRALEEMGIFGEHAEDASGDGAHADAMHNPSSGLALSGRNTTVLYELTIAGAETNEYELLWNAAFDDFLSNRVEDATRKLMAWRRLFGERPTLTRIMRILGEEGGYHGPIFHRATGARGFEPNFII